MVSDQIASEYAADHNTCGLSQAWKIGRDDHFPTAKHLKAIYTKGEV